MTIALLAVAASAQTNTTTTVTIYVPNVSITYRPVIAVYPHFLDNGTLVVRVTCLTLGSCPNVTLTVSNGTVSYTELVTMGSCPSPPCYNETRFNITGRVVVIVSYDGVSKQFVVYSPKVGGKGRDILTLAIVLGVASLAFRSDKRFAAAGLIAGAVVAATAAALGFIEPTGYVVAVLSIIAGVLILWS